MTTDTAGPRGASGGGSAFIDDEGTGPGRAVHRQAPGSPSHLSRHQSCGPPRTLPGSGRSRGYPRSMSDWPDDWFRRDRAPGGGGSEPADPAAARPVPPADRPGGQRPGPLGPDSQPTQRLGMTPEAAGTRVLPPQQPAAAPPPTARGGAPAGPPPVRRD